MFDADGDAAVSVHDDLIVGALRLGSRGNVPCAARNSSLDCRPLEPSLGFSILGDSISTLWGYVPQGWRVHYEGEVHVPGVECFADTWWGRVIDHFGGQLISNSSFSGSVVEGFGFPAGVSDERIASLVGPHGELPDVVIVYMGINDYGWGGGRNQVMGGSLSASAKPEDLEGARMVEPVVGPVALERFSAAYALMVQKIRLLAPDASIWCLTLAPATSPDIERRCYKYQISGIELDAYNDAIRSVAIKSGARVIDIRSYGIAYDAVDGCHPSALGMRQLADMVVDQIEGRASGRAPLSIHDAPHARRSCFCRNCSGCPHDESVPSRWTIVCSGPSLQEGTARN